MSPSLKRTHSANADDAVVDMPSDGIDDAKSARSDDTHDVEDADDAMVDVEPAAAAGKKAKSRGGQTVFVDVATLCTPLVHATTGGGAAASASASVKTNSAGGASTDVRPSVDMKSMTCDERNDFVTECVLNVVTGYNRKDLYGLVPSVWGNARRSDGDACIRAKTTKLKKLSDRDIMLAIASARDVTPGISIQAMRGMINKAVVDKTIPHITVDTMMPVLYRNEEDGKYVVTSQPQVTPTGVFTSFSLSEFDGVSALAWRDIFGADAEGVTDEALAYSKASIATVLVSASIARTFRHPFCALVHPTTAEWLSEAMRTPFAPPYVSGAVKVEVMNEALAPAAFIDSATEASPASLLAAASKIIRERQCPVFVVGRSLRFSKAVLQTPGTNLRNPEFIRKIPMFVHSLLVTLADSLNANVDAVEVTTIADASNAMLRSMGLPTLDLFMTNCGRWYDVPPTASENRPKKKSKLAAATAEAQPSQQTDEAAAKENDS